MENNFTFENPEYRKMFWHTSSHVMAQAVKRLWPEVQLAIGPAIDEGWYYDIDAPFAFTPDHLKQIEGEMKKIVKERSKLETIEGSVPNPTEKITGCSFRPRCPYATERCAQEEPPVVQIDSDRQVKCWQYVQTAAEEGERHEQ